MPPQKNSKRCSTASALAVFALLASPSSAHTWIQQMWVVNPSNYSYVGKPGYSRANMFQTAPGFNDFQMVHILPSNSAPALEQRALEERQAPAAAPATPATPPGLPSPSQPVPIAQQTFNAVAAVDTQGLTNSDTMCKKLQYQQTQSAGSPRLQAAPGDLVALQYQENGHVVLPGNQPGKQPNRGNLYLYGTSQPKFPELFLDVFNKWTKDGKGGDRRGRLLATGNFDDGQCYQDNAKSPISTDRKARFPKTADTLMGTNLWCQMLIQIPTDAPSSKPYTLYWVWDWPTEPNVDHSLMAGKPEIYTTCMDVDVTGTKVPGTLGAQAPPDPPGPSIIATQAIARQVKAIMDSSPAAPSPAAPQASSPAAQAPYQAPAANAPASGAGIAANEKKEAVQAAPVASTPTPAAATPAGNVAMSASEQVIASEMLAYLDQAVASKYPGAAGLLKSGGAAPVTVTVTVQGSAAAAAAPTTMQKVYAASTSVQAGAQAPSQAPAAAAPTPPAASAAPSIPPSSLVLQAPVTSGAPPAAVIAAAPAAPTPATSAATEAGAPPMAPTVSTGPAPAAAASTAQALANAETAPAPIQPAASSSAPAPAAASPAAASSAKIGTYTGTAMPAATGGISGGSGYVKRNCANKACKKMAKRSRILG